MNIQLITDSGADIPEHLAQKINIITVPLYLHFSDGEYVTGKTIDLQGYHKKVKELNEVPQSSAPSPNDFYHVFKKVPADRPIIVLSLSQGLSSTYTNAAAGKTMLLEEEPERQIKIIDTKTASCGISLLLYELHQKTADYNNLEELVNYIEACVEKTATLFILDTLDNLVRGGRVSKVTGKIAKTLNIKLLMREKDGKIDVSEKVRGEKKAVRRFIDQIGEYTKDFETKSLFMTHCNSEDRASKLLEEIKAKYKFKETYLSEMGPLIATHGGDGAVVIAFFRD